MIVYICSKKIVEPTGIQPAQNGLKSLCVVAQLAPYYSYFRNLLTPPSKVRVGFFMYQYYKIIQNNTSKHEEKEEIFLYSSCFFSVCNVKSNFNYRLILQVWKIIRITAV